MQTFPILLIWLGSAVALVLLADITHRARKRLRALEEAAEAQPAFPAKPIQPPEEMSRPSVPAEADMQEPPGRPSGMLIALGVLAALLAPLWPIAIALNSYVIALSLGAFLPQGVPLFTLTVGPWIRDIYVNDLVAVVVCLFEAVGGATWLRCAMTRVDTQVERQYQPLILKLERCALALTAGALFFEVAAGFYRGLKIGDLYNAFASALASLVAGLGEVVLGALVIGFFLIPVAMAVVNLFRRRRARRESAEPPVPVAAPPRFPRYLRFLAFVDEVVMDRLRAVDRWVHCLLRPGTRLES